MTTWYILYYGPDKANTFNWYGSSPDEEKVKGWASQLEAKGFATDVDKVLARSEEGQ